VEAGRVQDAGADLEAVVAAQRPVHAELQQVAVRRGDELHVEQDLLRLPVQERDDLADAVQDQLRVADDEHVRLGSKFIVPRVRLRRVLRQDGLEGLRQHEAADQLFDRRRGRQRLADSVLPCSTFAL
jgi:hypothetical protein